MELDTIARSLNNQWDKYPQCNFYPNIFRIPALLLSIRGEKGECSYTTLRGTDGQGRINPPVNDDCAANKR